MTRWMLAMMVLLLATPLAQADGWRGGGAPAGVELQTLTAETDGTLVGVTTLPELSMVTARPGGGFVRQPAVGLPRRGLLTGDVFGVAGGLRATTLDGTLYASVNDGATWAAIGTLAPDFTDSHFVLGAAIDRLTPAHALRVFDDGAVQRSVDGGATWASAIALPLPESDPPVNASVEFAADGTVYVRLENVLWRSGDLGDAWQRLPGAPVGALVPSPAAANVVWSAGRGGVYRSDDAGTTWRRSHDAASVIASPVDAQVAWALEANRALLTEDGGTTWHQVPGFPRARNGRAPAIALPGLRTALCVGGAGGLWCSDGGPFRVDLGRAAGNRIGPDVFAADPVVPGRAVGISGALVWETTDGSRTWHVLDSPVDLYGSVAITRSATWLASTDGVLVRSRGSAGWHRRAGPRGRASLAADPRSGTVYAIASGRLWRATPGARFHLVPARGIRLGNLSVTEVGAGGRTVLVEREEKVWVSTDRGTSFRRLAKAPDGIFVALSPFDPQRLVGTSLRGVYVSADLGRHWRHTARVFSVVVVADPWRRGRWFTSEGRPTLVSTDDGRSWRAFHPQPPSATATGLLEGFQFCCQLAVTPGRLWAAEVLRSHVYWYPLRP